MGAEHVLPATLVLKKLMGIGEAQVCAPAIIGTPQSVANIPIPKRRFLMNILPERLWVDERTAMRIKPDKCRNVAFPLKKKGSQWLPFSVTEELLAYSTENFCSETGRMPFTVRV
jgi:hypothetical protein